MEIIRIIYYLIPGVSTWENETDGQRQEPDQIGPEAVSGT
jgi:hypothetical protein